MGTPWGQLRIASVLALGGVCAVLPVEATTYHVSPQGSNIPPYDSYVTAAYEVRAAVLLTSGEEDTVWIHTGVYDIDTTIDLPMGVVYPKGGDHPK